MKQKFCDNNSSSSSIHHHHSLILLCPRPLFGWGIKRWCCLTSVCLAYIRPKSRTERPRKTKIGKEVAHVTRDSDTTVKVTRSRSPGRFTHLGVNASGSCSCDSGNVLTVGSYCDVAVCSSWLGGAIRFGAHRGRRGGHIVAASLRACYFKLLSLFNVLLSHDTPTVLWILIMYLLTVKTSHFI